MGSSDIWYKTRLGSVHGNNVGGKNPPPDLISARALLCPGISVFPDVRNFSSSENMALKVCSAFPSRAGLFDVSFFTGATSVETVGLRTRFGQHRATFGRRRPVVIDRRPSMPFPTRVAPISNKIGPVLAEVGPTCPKTSQIQPSSDQCGEDWLDDAWVEAAPGRNFRPLETTKVRAFVPKLPRMSTRGCSTPIVTTLLRSTDKGEG